MEILAPVSGDVLKASQNRNISLISGSLWVSIWQLSWPMVLMMVLNFFVGLADLYVAGLISPDVQAAVGFISQIYFLVIVIANAISTGSIVLVSRAAGAGSFARTVEISRQSLIFGALIAAAVTVIGLIFNRQIILIAGFPPEIRDIAERFLIIFAFALGPNYLLIISNAVFRAAGEVRKPLLTMFFVSLINIAGDFVLVLGIPPFPKMGYTGIALSTALSVSGGMLINLSLFGTRRWSAIYRGAMKPSGKLIQQIVRIGWPSVLLQLAWTLGSIALFNILGRLGEKSITALASYSNGLRIEAIIFLPAFALNMAASVLVGQNLGAGKADRAESLGWKIARTGVVILVLMALPIFIWAEYFAAILAGTPDVLGETARYLRYNMTSEPFMAMGAVLSGALMGAGDTRGAMWIIVFCMWIIRLPLAYFFALILGFGAPGVWAAMVCSMICQGALMAARYRRGEWKKIEVD